MSLSLIRPERTLTLAALGELAVLSDKARYLAELTQTADQFANAEDRALADRDNFWSAVIAQTGVPRDVWKVMGCPA